jgi:cell division protein FtsN
MAKRTKKTADLILKARDGSTWVFELKVHPDSGVSERDFAEKLRLAIEESGISQYHLAEVAEVPQGAISVFLAGGDLRLSTFTRLAHVMGLELQQDSAKAPKKIEQTTAKTVTPKTVTPKTVTPKTKKAKTKKAKTVAAKPKTAKTKTAKPKGKK